MQARRQRSSLKICPVYNKVAVSGDVVIGKRGLSIVDTRVPAIATTVSSVSHSGHYLDIRPHGNQISLRGHHQRARQLLPPDLHRIKSESASSRWAMMGLMLVHNRRLTSIVGICKIVCHRRAFEIRMRTGAREDLMTRTLSSLCLYIMTFCYDPINAVSKYPLHTAEGRRWRIRCLGCSEFETA